MGLFAFYSVRGYGFDTVNNKAEVMKCMIARLGPVFARCMKENQERLKKVFDAYIAQG